MITAFNPKYYMDALRAIDDDTVCILYSSSLSPCIIQGSQTENYHIHYADPAELRKGKAMQISEIHGEFIKLNQWLKKRKSGGERRRSQYRDRRRTRPGQWRDGGADFGKNCIMEIS